MTNNSIFINKRQNNNILKISFYKKIKRAKTIPTNSTNPTTHPSTLFFYTAISRPNANLNIKPRNSKKHRKHSTKRNSFKTTM